MSNVTIQKRGKYYQYKFEIAKIDGKRKFLSKSGFKTKIKVKDNLVGIMRIGDIDYISLTDLARYKILLNQKML